MHINCIFYFKSASQQDLKDLVKSNCVGLFSDLFWVLCMCVCVCVCVTVSL